MIPTTLPDGSPMPEKAILHQAGEVVNIKWFGAIAAILTYDLTSSTYGQNPLFHTIKSHGQFLENLGYFGKSGFEFEFGKNIPLDGLIIVDNDNSVLRLDAAKERAADERRIEILNSIAQNLHDGLSIPNVRSEFQKLPQLVQEAILVSIALARKLAEAEAQVYQRTTPKRTNPKRTTPTLANLIGAGTKLGMDYYSGEQILEAYSNIASVNDRRALIKAVTIKTREAA